jgi:hypothetical protein
MLSHSQGWGLSVSEAEGGGIFVSYRRQETSGTAGRLADQLANHFGVGRVFMDVDTIEPGVDFAEAIARALETCEVLLAVIGPLWLTATDKQGRRRLDDPDDIVRIEIQAALARNVRVIPILVENAVMPPRQDLPESLASLARRNAFIVRHESFRYDAERLVTSIQAVIEVRDREQADKAARPKKAAQPSPRVTQQQGWQLELLAEEGDKTLRDTTFRLSSGGEVYLIAIHLNRKGSEWIEVDEKRVAENVNINDVKYPLTELGSKLGSRVTIVVKRGPEIAQVWSVTLKIGDQVVTYKA